MRSPSSSRSRISSILHVNINNILDYKITRSQSQERTNIDWSKRELHWYFSEDRLLFASDSSNTIQKWVLLLQWLIKENNSK